MRVGFSSWLSRPYILSVLILKKTENRSSQAGLGEREETAGGWPTVFTVDSEAERITVGLSLSMERPFRGGSTRIVSRKAWQNRVWSRKKTNTRIYGHNGKVMGPTTGKLMTITFNASPWNDHMVEEEIWYTRQVENESPNQLPYPPSN